jgi:3-oxoacyl-[acyl-carrier protein] reductase
MQLKDQIALVTGGSRGIGRGIVLALAKEGAKVAFVYHSNADAATALEQEVAATGGFAKGVKADVADPAAAETVVSAIVAEHGRLDILVNNAGVIRDKLFVRMGLDDWNAVINTNLTGVFTFCKVAGEQMALKQRKGRIVNISSIAAEHVNKGQANYAASKGAINSFTRVLAAELGARNVLVNAVAPGFIATDMSAAVRNMAGEDNLKKLIPVKRLGAAEDIASVVVFLCGPGSAYITGQVITVDGGLSLGAVSG